ncbi:PadR family transcriptional regulator [Halorussus limi]|uniref:PadR family transcriptional regulator n=1 Tax=Halorussus limi TaxID=2938695 RepID=A0A8U0HY87_9EURY|nr:helix-turn-helix transcriptional regulator [Halorussus limi]UPV75888.1 PadR family transcriptional regulator [Halorussus limi]
MSETAAVGFPEFHAFERDLLFAVCALERDGDAPHGLAIKSYLEAEYDEEINHSRLYQNLDALVERGLLRKGAKDDRTNEYITTDSGRLLLERRAKRRADQLGLDLRDSTAENGGDLE